MEIHRTEKNGQTIFALKGRLDGNTADQLLADLKGCESPAILLECKDLDYVSSAGLRVILTAHKQCAAKGGKLSLRNVGKMLAELLDMTGFSSFIDTV